MQHKFIAFLQDGVFYVLVIATLPLVFLAISNINISVWSLLTVKTFHPNWSATYVIPTVLPLVGIFLAVGLDQKQVLYTRHPLYKRLLPSLVLATVVFSELVIMALAS